MDTIELLGIKVKDVMTKDVISVQENDSMQIVYDIMNTSKIHHVPVTDDDNNLKGMLSKIDVVLLQDWATNLNLKSAQAINKQVLASQKAGDRMAVQVAKVSPDDTLEVCADIFKENLFHCLPVLEEGELVGIITTFDLLRIAYSKPTFFQV
ncbi:MAG: CBS domain-containing protein [Saprospiraceae bacterium]|nr:CBS domain-containing protein [Saprospiraceae bacterium]